jgi:transcription-repair coupling factor (superfamily II helicase)
VWDEPELIRAAADRLWKRLDDPERPSWCPPQKVFRTFGELRSISQSLTEVDLRELEVSANTQALHVSTRPAISFHGNMPAAIAEARNLVEAGQRVAFFGSTAGEVERVADIFHEYNVPYQLGLEQNTKAPEYLAQRAYMAGDVANIFLIQGRIARGTVLQDSGIAVFGSEDLFDASSLVSRPTAT